MDINTKRDKSPETLRLIDKRKKILKLGNLRFKYGSNLNREVLVPRRPDKSGRDEIAAIDVEKLFRNNERKRRGSGYFKFKEPTVSTSIVEPIKIHRKCVNHRGKLNSTPDSQSPYRTSETLKI